MSDVKRYEPMCECENGRKKIIGHETENGEYVLASDYDALRAELEAANKRLDWLELHLFDGKWDGTIGVPKTWHMAGPYRHTMQRMKGNTLRIAIDAAIAGEKP